MPHPYRELPDRQFWRRAVAGLPPAEIDPFGPAPFRIAKTDRIATAGSCFAQHLSAALRDAHFHHFVPEPAPAGLSADEAARRQYGVFSCRTGNIYTTRQLRQLLDRAYGRFVPALDIWARPDGRLADPFRPTIEPDGFADAAALHADRAAHLAAVRRMFETLDVFIFTLGQTECWQSVADGAVVPVAPGVAGGETGDCRFANMRIAEVAADLLAFAGGLSKVNPRARIILTVSPVPMIATYERKHVLVANAASKAILRAAVEEVVAERPDIVYFPSYEIVTSPATMGRFQADDLRNVRPLGVAAVMRIFFRHFAGGMARRRLRIDVGRESRELSSVVCDEVALDPG